MRYDGPCILEFDRPKFETVPSDNPDFIKYRITKTVLPIPTGVSVEIDEDGSWRAFLTDT